MNALKEPERITLVEGVELLQSRLPTEEAKTRLRQAFIRKAFRQVPLFALSYDDADIDWTTGSVKIPRKRDRFVPTFSRAEFNAYFFEEEAERGGQREVNPQEVLRSLGLASKPAPDFLNVGWETE
jgi:hypothetical protein